MTFKILLLLKLDSIKVYQKEKLLMCQNQVTEKRVNRKKTTVTTSEEAWTPHVYQVWTGNNPFNVVSYPWWQWKFFKISKSYMPWEPLYQNHQLLCSPLRWWIYLCGQCNRLKRQFYKVGYYWLNQQIESRQVFMGTNMKDLESRSAIMIYVQSFQSQREVSFTCQSQFFKWQVKCPDNWQINQTRKM